MTQSIGIEPHASMNGMSVMFGRRLNSIADQFTTNILKGVKNSNGTVSCHWAKESLVAPSESRPNRGLIQLLHHLRRFVGQDLDCLLPKIASLSPPKSVESLDIQTTPQLHQFVYNEEMGLVQVSAGVARERLIAELAAAFPKATVAVLASSNECCKRICRAMNQLGVHGWHVRAKKQPRAGHRIVVGTPHSMAHSTVEFEKRQLILAFDALHLLANSRQMALLGPDIRGRLFGFVQEEKTITEYEQDWLFALFGFEQLDISRHGCKSVDVVVHWQYPKLARVSGTTPLSIRRKGIWRNQQRNQLIAQIARAERAKGKSVLVLVDNLEHLDALSGLMTDWPVVFDRSTDPNVLASFQNLQNQSKAWFIDHAIATVNASLRAPIRGAATIIWAGSGAALPNIPNEWLVQSLGSENSLQMIDFLDQHNPALSNWSELRREAYENKEWLSADVTVSKSLWRIGKFLMSKGLTSNE